MPQNFLHFEFFKTRDEYGVVFLRLLIGMFIIWGVADNILSCAHMLEFEKFLGARGVPYPLFAAHLSVYAQFICDVSILFGAFVTPTSIVFIIKFHRRDRDRISGNHFGRYFPRS